MCVGAPFGRRGTSIGSLPTFHSSTIKLKTKQANQNSRNSFRFFVMTSPLAANYKDSKGRTAARGGDVETVQLLLADQRVDMNHSDKTSVE